MRILILFTNFILFLASCGETKTIAQNNTSNQNSINVIEYEAVSRGYFLAITIDKDSITKFKDRNRKESASVSCSLKDWNTIIADMKKIEFEKITDLKAPSDKRTFDGAAHAQLKITTSTQIYTSNSFDHGNPPQELKSLVDTILSLTESIE